MNYDRWIARWEGEGGALAPAASASKRSAPEPTRAIKLRTILVPIDFSPESLKTLRYAKLFAKRFNAELHLVHVLDTPLVTPLKPSLLSASKGISANAKKRLAELAAKSSLPSKPARHTMRTGKIADEINELARRTNAGLIAIATRGFTGLKHAFVGSTTERVVRTAPCPVLVVRNKEDAAAKVRSRSGRAAPQFHKVLVPVDFSENSRLGIEYALRFAREFGADVVLFHSVFVTPFVLGDEYTAREVPTLIPLQQDYAEEEMDKLRQEIRAKGKEVETEIALGSPVEQINNYVTKEDVDLIVTSTHGRSGLERLFIGSTAERIVRYAPSPVLVVPNRIARKQATKAGV
jgi:nucleotide-binding universal stress UspA family protein